LVHAGAGCASCVQATALVQLLSTSGSDFCRQQAAVLLGDLVQGNTGTTAAVVQALTPLLAHDAWDVRVAAAEAVYHVCRRSRGE
jgi:hypothetical protein